MPLARFVRFAGAARTNDKVTMTVVNPSTDTVMMRDRVGRTDKGDKRQLTQVKE